MINKSTIISYIDKYNKGYISLQDICRILFHCIIWIGILNAPIILLYIEGKVPINTTIFDSILFNIICWLGTIVLVVFVLFVSFGITSVIKSNIFYNIMIKLNNIKLIKLK